ncbi:MAG: DNA polymerase III subunit [Acidimicrobiales bacterium]
MRELAPTDVPVVALFENVVGQPRAVAQLRASARRPVHAYLFFGPAGSGKREAARGFAAALLCPRGGCGVCSTCRRSLAGTHPDLVEVNRTGASLAIEDARTIGVQAQRHPLEGSRQVLVVHDIHLSGSSVPALLKTVEEPPPGTIFVLVGDELPPNLVTIASRCAKVAFDPVPADVVVTWLVGQGASRDIAQSAAAASGGHLDRAKLLATDPGFAARLLRWRSVPAILDGTGAAAATVALDLLNSADEVLGPLRAQHAAEMVALSDAAGLIGAKGIRGRKEVVDRHKREERRWRTDEIRTGLAALAEVYREKLLTTTESGEGIGSVGTEGDCRQLLGNVETIERAASMLDHNPNEALLMESLMVRLSGLCR